MADNNTHPENLKFGFSFSDPLANYIYSNYAHLLKRYGVDRALSILDKNFTVTNLTKEQLISHMDAYSDIDIQFDGDDYIIIKNGVLIKSTFSSRKSHYDLDNTIFAPTHKQAVEAYERFENHFKDYKSSLFGFSIEWKYKGGSYNTTEYVDETIHDEAYPNIRDVKKFVEDYLNSKEPVLILRGIAGSGKTRLIRLILREMCRRNKEQDRYSDPSVLYTMDEKLLHDDGFFVEFLNSRYNILVLEDLDNYLESRRSGNRSMSKLLTVSDGVVQTIDKKIIISTNLHNLGDFDEALLRAGRCFANVKFRKLAWEEVEILTNTINPDFDLSTVEQKEYTLAEVYEFISEKDIDAEVTDERFNVAGFN